MTEDARGGAWAMPGSAAEQDEEVPPPGTGPVPTGPAPGAPGPPGPPPAPSPDAVPRVALRPMTVADVLDGGFAIVKARPRRILGFAAAFVVPIQLAAALALRDDFAATGIWFGGDGAFPAESSSDGGDLLASIALGILPSVALVCVAAGVAHLVSGWSVGRDASAREMLGVVGRRWWPLLATFVVVHLAEIAGAFACYVGLVFVMPLFVAVAPVIGAEGASTGEALGRSVRLARARYWPTLGTALLMGLVASLLGLALSSVPQAVALTLEPESGWALYALAGILSQVVTTPFVAAATVLLYLDLRVRTEGLDIELTARELLDAPA